MGRQKMEIGYKTDWRSLYILTIVAFLGAFKIGANSTNLWPYLTLHDSSITESFYGFMISISNAGNLLAAFAMGWLSNQLQHTKPAIMSGKVLAFLGAIAYLSVELVDSNQRILFLAMEIFFGLGHGCSSVSRTYVSMASTEKSRAKAFGMISLAITLGHATGPFIMAIFSRMKYPGIELGYGLHLNLYSAPIYLLIITIFVSVILLTFWFDGKMRLLKSKPVEEKEFENKKKPKMIDPSVLPKHKRFDKIAVFVCCSTRFLMTIGMVFGQSLSSPYMMTAFRWTRPQYIFISSIMHTIIGLIGVGFSLLYIFVDMRKRLSERRAIIIAMIMKLAFFLITYPWAVYEKTIAYEVVSVNETTGKLAILEPGCKLAYDWCQYTPAVNPYLYCIAQVILLGISVPLMHLNLEILYSKVLGQIKQGTMQGVFIICGDILQVVGPILLTQVYQHFGVKYVWGLIIATMVSILALWFIFYNRMISSSRRLGLERVDTFTMDTD